MASKEFEKFLESKDAVMVRKNGDFCKKLKDTETVILRNYTDELGVKYDMYAINKHKLDFAKEAFYAGVKSAKLEWHRKDDTECLDDDWYFVALKYQCGATVLKTAYHRFNDDGSSRWRVDMTDHDYFEIYAWAEIPDLPDPESKKFSSED